VHVAPSTRPRDTTADDGHDRGNGDPAVTGAIGGEIIVRHEELEIDLLVAHEEVTVTRAWCAAGRRIAHPHVHSEHTDSFYVLEGELTFELGRESETFTVTPGGFVAVPPGLAHSFRTGGDRPARWLTIHARDGGFAAFMRGVRDGVEVDWDISAVPPGHGFPARHAIVSRPLGTPGNGVRGAR
jgi:quercetin dioxygenase-like cupin family protein